MLCCRLDYYNGKLDSILKDKAAAEAKGKTFDHEKVDRNQQKRNDALQVYETVNAECIRQLQEAEGRKGEVLMQVFSAFELVERKVAQTYLAAVSAPLTVLPTSAGRRDSGTVKSVAYPERSTALDPGTAAPTVSLGLEGVNGTQGGSLLSAQPPPYQPTVFQPRPPSPQPRPPGSPQPAPPRDPPPPPTKRL